MFHGVDTAETGGVFVHMRAESLVVERSTDGDTAYELEGCQLVQRFGPEISIHAVPGINVPQFPKCIIISVRLCGIVFIRLDHISYYSSSRSISTIYSG